MSSRELLALIDELPESSKFKEASERTRRIVERDGKLFELAATVKTTDGLLFPVELPDNAVLVAEYVDWTHDRKLLARQARELAAFRMEARPPGQGYDVDFGGLTEPRQAILADRAQRAHAENLRGAKNVIRSALFANERR